MGFKEKITRFHQWQRRPLHFSYNYDKKDKRHCKCCGEDFSGNFCPACGQKATFGPITWKSVKAGIMDVWGLSGRSLPRTLWHLFLRPGYLIGDYISGKRQVSFPPVKMLVIVALVVYFLVNWIDPSSFEEEHLKPFSNSMSGIDKFDYYFTIFSNRIQTHIDWLCLLILSFLIYPTWVVFRYAPQHGHHTIPQGFFIQVFNSIVILIIAPVVGLIEKFEKDSYYYNLLLGVFYVIIFLHLLRTYKQLFGYGWWSTTWRLVAVAIAGIGMLISMVILFGLVVFAIYGDWDVLSRNIFNILIYVLGVVIILVGSHLINKRKLKKVTQNDD